MSGKSILQFRRRSPSITTLVPIPSIHFSTCVSKQTLTQLLHTHHTFHLTHSTKNQSIQPIQQQYRTHHIDWHAPKPWPFLVLVVSNQNVCFKVGKFPLFFVGAIRCAFDAHGNFSVVVDGLLCGCTACKDEHVQLECHNLPFHTEHT